MSKKKAQIEVGNRYLVPVVTYREVTVSAFGVNAFRVWVTDEEGRERLARTVDLIPLPTKPATATGTGI